jgi:hypothetical protein
MGDPQYVDIGTPEGNTLRILYEVTVGDLLVVVSVGVLLMAFILFILLRKLWR